MQHHVSKNLQFGILLLGAFVTVLNAGVTNVALPNIAADLNATGIQIHLIADGFLIALASGVLIFGAIGDKYGRKKLFITGLLLTIVASLLSSLSPTANILIFWRIIAGLAMAMLYPTTLSMTTTIFTEPKQRLMSIGIWSGVSAAGAAVAPIIAGILLTFFDWGSVFAISAPLALLTLILGILFLASDIIEKSTPSVDWLGGFLSAAFITSLLIVIIFIPVTGFDTAVIAGLITSCITLTLFIFRETHTKHPLLNLSVFKNRPFALASVTVTLIAFAQLGVMFLAQEYVQDVLGYTPIEAGLSALPLSIMLLIASPLSAKLVGKYSSRKVVCVGLVLVGTGFLTALSWSVHSPYWQILISYLLIGTGVGFTLTPMTNVIMNTLPQSQAGIGSAVNDVTRDFGQALGVAVNGSIAAIGYTQVLKATYENVPEPQRIQISQDVATIILSSLSGALEIAKKYPGIDAEKLVEAAKHAFLVGQLEAMLLSSILCFTGAIIIFLFFPRKHI